MKKIHALCLCTILCACSGNAKQSVTNVKATNEKEQVTKIPSKPEGIPVLDVNKKYPKKSFSIQDIADVEYVPLGITDDILWLRRELEYMDEDHIIGANSKTGVMIHDRQGKPLHHFHRQGGGPEEYKSIFGLCYDKKTDEMFINDFMGNKIHVYDLKGNHKRSFCTGFGGQNRVNEIKIFNDETLLGYVQDDYWVLLSRTNGKKMAEKSLRADKVINLRIRKEGGGQANVGMDMMSHQRGEHIISSYATDTIFRLTPDFKLQPLMAKIPASRSMEIPVFMAYTGQTPRYLFVNTIKKEYDFDKQTGYPSVDYIVDKTDNQIYERGSITNNDYQGQEVYMEDINADQPSGIYLQSIRASSLVEAYEKGKLSGKLKEIASKLKEDDNPVLMIIKLRK